MKLKFSVSNIFVIILLAFSVFYFVRRSGEKKDPNIISVGTSADFPPFTFMSDDKMVGFDIDLINEIANRLNKKTELKNMPFGTLLPSLQLGNIDVIASGLTATPERAQRILFTSAYIENNPLVIISLSAKPAQNIQDLNNKEVVVNEGYTADLYMSKLTGPILKRLKTPAEAFLALKSGRAFAFVTAQNTVKPFFEKYGADQFHIATIPDTEESASLAIAPQNQELLKKVQEVLDLMKTDGSLQNLKNKWGL